MRLSLRFFSTDFEHTRMSADEANAMGEETRGVDLVLPAKTIPADLYALNTATILDVKCNGIYTLSDFGSVEK